MPKLILDKETAIEEWGLPSEGSDAVDIVTDEVTDTSRWSVHHELIIKTGDKYYRTYYSVGSTECQDEGPWENDDEVELREVYPAQVVTTIFKPVKD